jgi:aspartokinase/homoserine dehydrogenase 1
MEYEEAQDPAANDAEVLPLPAETAEQQSPAGDSQTTTRQKHSVKVLKFGGSSLAGAGRILRAARIAQRAAAEHRIAVVVSALRGVTDRLVSLTGFLSKGAGGVAFAEAGLLIHLHHEIARELNLKSRDAVRLHTETESLGGELFAALRAHRHGSGGDEAFDRIVSFGERFSCRVFAAALKKLGIAAAPVDAPDFLVTSADFGAARPLLEATAARAKEIFPALLREGIVPVVTGFAGATHDGRITTLGRNSSDYSGAIVAHVLGAAELVIWTDVDGMYTTNPRHAPAARLLTALSYERAQALAEAGAKVLHPGVIPLAAKTQMKISICNALNPRAPGTRIGPRSETEPS